jgi:hypothetical protein
MYDRQRLHLSCVLLRLNKQLKKDPEPADVTEFFCPPPIKENIADPVFKEPPAIAAHL